MEQQTELEQIEISLEQSQKLIQRKDALDRLINNSDFKQIILEEYFEKESHRLTLLKADSTMQSKESQKEIIKQIDAIGMLHQYFQAIRLIGFQAQKALDQDSETRQDLLKEEHEGAVQ